ncbi:hypothetical protein [Colwellia echini]|uniref:Carboxypeptidase regulatory-like domain-containing protein n=1 Tax=Colwellia echini TaxID=1982103 RepID=A0ABY3MUK0_9GAMM|nr:hypothetical protein [Colwellia echini]TYK64860.1 hypothetical protein CWS31_013675 [Colwellia echini]
MKNCFYKFILITSIMLSGCEDSSDSVNNGDVACTEQYVSGLTIEIIDKATGEPIACNVTAIIEDNDYSEEVTSFSSGECDNAQYLQGAGERSGIYNIHVSKEGYLDWSVYNIELTSNVCHVETVHIIAELEK